MTLIRLRWADGKTREWEWSGVPSLAESRVIKERLNLTINGFREGLQNMDADCITGLLYILYRRMGDQVAWDEIDCDFDFGLQLPPRDGVPLLEMEDEEEEEEDESDAGEAPAGKASSTKSGRPKRAD